MALQYYNQVDKNKKFLSNKSNQRPLIVLSFIILILFIDKTQSQKILPIGLQNEQFLIFYYQIIYKYTNDMLGYPNKPASISDSYEERAYDRCNQNHTPSKRSKYDSFTPRKRYIKEHDEYDNYRNFQFDPSELVPDRNSYKAEPSGLYNSKTRNGSLRKKETVESNETKKYQVNDIYAPNFEKIYPTEGRVPLNQYTFNLNCQTSIRQAKFKNYLENKDLCKKICFDEAQNRDKSNIASSKIKRDHIENKQRFLDIESDYNLTPRRLNKKRDENPGQLNEKLSMVQAKIARLQRMTPKRCSAPKASQVIEIQIPDCSSFPLEKQEPKPETTASSRVSVVSERQNQIMSRVSLGRLVEQQQCQTEIEVIQDLSYKISSKLRSIIRNFG